MKNATYTNKFYYGQHERFNYTPSGPNTLYKLFTTTYRKNLIRSKEHQKLMKDIAQLYAPLAKN